MLPRTILTVEQLKEKVAQGFNIAILQHLETGDTLCFFVNNESYIQALKSVGIHEKKAYGIEAIEYDWDISKSLHVTKILMEAPQEAVVEISQPQNS